jgi:hypothetical protein
VRPKRYPSAGEWLEHRGISPGSLSARPERSAHVTPTPACIQVGMGGLGATRVRRELHADTGGEKTAAPVVLSGQYAQGSSVVVRGLQSPQGITRVRMARVGQTAQERAASAGAIAD